MSTRVFFLTGWTARWDTPYLYAASLKAHVESLGAAFIPMDLVVDSGPIEEYVTYLSSLVGEPDERTFFVTQSIGGQLALRYLASLAPGARVGGVFAIAGWFSVIPVGELPAALVQWCNTATLDLARVNAACTTFVLLIGDDDSYCNVPEQVAAWRKSVGAKTIVRAGRGHYITPTLLQDDLAEISSFLGM